MKLLQFLILFYIFTIHQSTACSTTDQIKFLQCKGGILKIQDMLKLYAPATFNSEKQPPQSAFKQISKLCKGALHCVEQIECVEAKKGVGLMGIACEGIELSAGPFGECMAKLQTNPPDEKTYPCAAMFQTDALDSKAERCKLFTEDVECIVRISKDHCGAPAADAFKKGVPSMKTILRC